MSNRKKHTDPQAFQPHVSIAKIEDLEEHVNRHAGAMQASSEHPPKGQNFEGVLSKYMDSLKKTNNFYRRNGEGFKFHFDSVSVHNGGVEYHLANVRRRTQTVRHSAYPGTSAVHPDSIPHPGFTAQPGSSIHPAASAAHRESTAHPTH